MAKILGHYHESYLSNQLVGDAEGFSGTVHVRTETWEYDPPSASAVKLVSRFLRLPAGHRLLDVVVHSPQTGKGRLAAVGYSFSLDGETSPVVLERTNTTIENGSLDGLIGTQDIWKEPLNRDIYFYLQTRADIDVKSTYRMDLFFTGP